MVARTMSPLSSPAIGFPLSREGVRASHHPRCSRGSFFVPIPWLFRSPYADFVPMPQQVGGILIDSVRPGPFQFILAIAISRVGNGFSLVFSACGTVTVFSDSI